MLINCPRCGFQQPKDKYCAQCGVDMENFKPASPPAWKKFFGSPLVQLSLLVVIAGGVGVTLYQKGQRNLERRVSYLKSTVQINSANNGEPMPVSALASDTVAETPPTEQASQEPAATDANGAVTAYKVTSPQEVAPASEKNDKDKKDARPVASAGAPHLVVYYAEVARGPLNRIVESSRRTGQFMNFNDYAAGILPKMDEALNAPHVKILHKEDRPLNNSKTLQWFYGLKDRRDPSVEIGLTTFFELNEMDAGNLRGNLEIQRTWREMNPSGQVEIQRKSFPAIFEIGGDTGFFMSGVMPSQSNLENDDELTAMDVYKILRSPQFRMGDSEFVIFVEFEKGN